MGLIYPGSALARNADLLACMRACFFAIGMALIACDEPGAPPASVRDAEVEAMDAGAATDAMSPSDGSANDGSTNDATTVSEDAALPRYTWWQDVEPIVAARCQLCHSDPPQFGAPRPFVRYEDTQVSINGTPAHQVMVYRLFAQQRRMPPSTQPQLTDDELRIIREWSESGAFEGTPPAADAGVEDDAGTPIDDDAGTPIGNDAGTPIDAETDAGTPIDDDAGTPINDDASTPINDAGQPPPDAGTNPRPISRSFELRAVEPGTTQPYVLPVQLTNYVCWALTIPPGGAASEFAFRFEPMLDNTTNLHHMLLLYDADGGNPAGPFSCNGLPLDWSMIAEWAPGRGADELPQGAGVPIQPGEQVVLQTHYDNVTAPGTTDNSGIRMILTDAPGQTPAGILWSGIMWSTPINGSNASLTHTCTLQQSFTAFGVFPHMHRTGARIMLEVQRAGASTWTPLVDVSGWSFEDQPHIPIAAAEQTMMPGDSLRTTCWWNTQGVDKFFGESSDDEMCFNFIYHYPRVPDDRACVGQAP